MNKFVTKIKTTSARRPSEITEYFIDDRWVVKSTFFKEEYNSLNNYYSFNKEKGLSPVLLERKLSTNNEWFFQSRPNDSEYDNLMSLPRN